MYRIVHKHIFRNSDGKKNNYRWEIFEHNKKVKVLFSKYKKRQPDSNFNFVYHLYEFEGDECPGALGQLEIPRVEAVRLEIPRLKSELKIRRFGYEKRRI